MAKRLAMVMDNTMTINNRYCQYSTMGANTFIKMAHNAKAAAPLLTTER